MNQLREKAISLADIDAEEKVVASIGEYDTLCRNLNDRIGVCENQVTNHEAYDQIVEKAQNWLKALKSEGVDVLNDAAAAFEKDGADEKLKVMVEVILQRPEGEH